MKTLKLTLIVFAALTLMTACKKDPAKGDMTVLMTDAPGDYKEVNVEIKAVEIHYTGGDTVNGWITLPTKAGIYDLLTLRDSVTALIASGVDLDADRVGQMRLILGSNNTVVIDSVGTFPLTIPSGENTGIKINIDADITVDQNLVITLDFDAEKSIIHTGNGDYKLKPVVRIKEIKTL